MKQFAATIPLGIGDLIYIKAMFEPIKHEYDAIRLSFHRELIDKFKRDHSYNDFINEFGKLLFDGAPYILEDKAYPFLSLAQMVSGHGLVPCKPELSQILCCGTPLNLDTPYIVLNTKVRQIPESHLEERIPEFWNLLNELSKTYKIVILGEKVIEMNAEYQYYTSKHIYSLYPHIYNNVPADRLIDMSVPALGITNPDIKNIQQDCLIMKNAKMIINFGIGGGFCLATSVGNTIGYRYDDDLVADMVFDRTYANAMITKEWPVFIQSLRKYL